MVGESVGSYFIGGEDDEMTGSSEIILQFWREGDDEDID